MKTSAAAAAAYIASVCGHKRSCGGVLLKTEKQKRIAVINDFSGFGRCSLTVSLPIISAAGIQCCAVPTAVLSNHTGYEDYFFDDYTDKMEAYFSKWEKLGLTFDGIYVGFLGSSRQTEIVERFIARFAGKDTVVITDPVMGDDGKTYATLTAEHCRSLKKLVSISDIITPNLTEACILASYPYNPRISDEFELFQLAGRIARLGGGRVVITGLEKGNDISNFIYDSDGEHRLISNRNAGSRRAGTGDVFSSIIAADAVLGIPLEESVKRAADFVAEAITISEAQGVPAQDGVCFEYLLGELADSYRKEK